MMTDQGLGGNPAAAPNGPANAQTTRQFRNGPQPPPRPTALALDPDGVPGWMRDLPQWVGWRYEVRKGKPTKVPREARADRLASSTDPATWSSWDDALARYVAGGLDGVGLVF